MRLTFVHLCDIKEILLLFFETTKITLFRRDMAQAVTATRTAVRHV
jgi:hypothetical protein